MALIVPPKPEMWPKRISQCQHCYSLRSLLRHASCNWPAFETCQAHMQLTLSVTMSCTRPVRVECPLLSSFGRNKRNMLCTRRLTKSAPLSQSMLTTMCLPWTIPGQTSQLCTLALMSWRVSEVQCGPCVIRVGSEDSQENLLPCLTRLVTGSPSVESDIHPQQDQAKCDCQTHRGQQPETKIKHSHMVC